MATPELMAELERLKSDESSFPELCSDEALQFFVDNDDGWYQMRAKHEQTIRRCGRTLVAVPKENPDGSVVMRDNGKPELDFVYTLGNSRAGHPDVLAFYPSSTAGFAVNKFCDAFKEGKVPVPDMDKGEVLKFKGCFEDESLEIVYYWIVGNQRKVAAEKYACQLNDDDPLLMLMIPTPDGRHHIEFIPDDMLDTSGAPTEESNFGKKVTVDEYLDNTFLPRLKSILNKPEDDAAAECLNFVVEFLCGWSAFHSELYNEKAGNRYKPEVVDACKEVNKRVNCWIDALGLEPDYEKGTKSFLSVLTEVRDTVGGENSERGRAIGLAAYFTAYEFESLMRAVIESGDDTNTPRTRGFVEQAVEVESLIKEVYKAASGKPLFEVERDEQRFPSKVVNPSDEYYTADEFLYVFKDELDEMWDKGESTDWCKKVVEYLIGWARVESEVFGKDGPKGYNPEISAICEKVTAIANRWASEEYGVEISDPPAFFMDTFEIIQKHIKDNDKGWVKASAYGAVVCCACLQARTENLIASEHGEERDNVLLGEIKEVVELVKQEFELAMSIPLFEAANDEQDEGVESSDKSPEKLEEERDIKALLQLLEGMEGKPAAGAIQFIEFLPMLFIEPLKAGDFGAEVDLSKESSQNSVELLEALGERTKFWAQILDYSAEDVKAPRALESVQEFISQKSYYKILGLFGFICLRAIALALTEEMKGQEEQKNFGLANSYKEVSEELEISAQCLKKVYANLLGTTLFLDA